MSTMSRLKPVLPPGIGWQRWTPAALPFLPGCEQLNPPPAAGMSSPQRALIAEARCYLRDQRSCRVARHAHRRAEANTRRSDAAALALAARYTTRFDSPSDFALTLVLFAALELSDVACLVLAQALGARANAFSGRVADIKQNGTASSAVRSAEPACAGASPAH